MTDPTQHPAASNRDKLAGLAQPTPASAPPPSAGVPPWEYRASDPAPPRELDPQSPAPFIPPVVTQPVELAESGMPLAGIWNRTWCWLVDAFIASILAVVFAVTLTIPLTFVSTDTGVLTALLVVESLGFFLTYYAAAYVWWGRTPAMMIPRLYVVDADDGGRLSWKRAYLRSLVLAAAQLFGIVAIIWVAIAAASPLKQGPHDKAGRSLVVQRPR